MPFLTMASQAGRKIMKGEVPGSFITFIPINKTKGKYLYVEEPVTLAQLTTVRSH